MFHECLTVFQRPLRYATFYIIFPQKNIHGYILNLNDRTSILLCISLTNMFISGITLYTNAYNFVKTQRTLPLSFLIHESAFLVNRSNKMTNPVSKLQKWKTVRRKTIITSKSFSLKKFKSVI